VRDLLAHSYAARVDLVGHSMGGLVARAYLAEPGAARRVRTLVLLGAPNQGSAATFEELGPNTRLPRTARDLLPTYPFLRDAITGRYLAPPEKNDFLPLLNRTRLSAAIRVYSIYGTDFATASVLLVRGAHYQIVGRISVPGDGTVTASSAALPGSRLIPLADGVRHQDLPGDRHVQLLIETLLAGNR
jgi:pimeloyl-ACP methyl ester carboxylesterase